MIREKDEVDIFSIVYKLRKERVLMVQTEVSRLPTLACIKKIIFTPLVNALFEKFPMLLLLFFHARG